MSHAVAGQGRSRLVAALAAAALLVAGAFALAAPGAASATDYICPKGSFCLWKDVDFKGGRYDWSRSDYDLNNDVYYQNGRRTSDKVGGTPSSLRNNGHAGAFEDVMVYQFPILPKYRGVGAYLCIPNGANYPNLPGFRVPGTNQTWNDNIQGFKWIPNGTC